MSEGISNEFLLEDRLTKIRSVIMKYGEENFYHSFSGGKDSTVSHHLLDMALPGNQIPRVFADTGIEYNEIRKFVKALKENDKRVVMLQPSLPIKETLKKYGYPFCSKQHGAVWQLYKMHGFKSKSVTSYYEHAFNYHSNQCPNILKYQFSESFDSLNISDKCCDYLKKKPMEQYSKDTGRKIAIVSIMAAEGGRRSAAVCLAFSGKKLKQFHPLAPVSLEWEQWFIDKYNIPLCKLYYPPYNFKRTGCKGCPFNMYLQKDLETMQTYFPNERKQCEDIWKPVYDEYRRIGYRLKKEEQIRMF